MKIKPHPSSLTLLCSLAVLLSFQLAASGQILTHRYSFFAEPDGSLTATDTVASADGILNPEGGNGATITGGQLVLDGVGGAYVQLPAGIITNDLAVTVEVWGDFPNAAAGTQGNWANLFDFGQQDVNNQDSYSLSFCVNVSGTDGECDAAISDADNANNDRENLYSPGTPLNGLTGAYVAVVFNPPQHYLAMYVNGVEIATETITNTITPGIKDVNNNIGYDNWLGDPTMTGNLDEFRIYNGALNSFQVAANYQAGWTATNATYGAITNIQLQLTYYTMEPGGSQSATVLGGVANLTNNALNVTTSCTFDSGNTNILTVSNNVITAVGEGSATVTAQSGSLTSAQTITVAPPVSVLTHRYSFFSAASGATTVADSIGTALCTLMGTAQISGGQLVLDGTTNSYASLPAKIINTNYTAVTIDAWASFSNSLPTGMFFDFGNTDTNSTYGEEYMFCSAASGRAAITASDPGYTSEQGVTTTGWAGRTNLHVTVVYNPPGGYIAVYTNGLLSGVATGVTDPISVVNDLESYMGRSDYEGDSGLPCEINEFRIFNGALTSQDAAVSDAAGMASVPSTVTNGPGALQSISFKAPASLTALVPGNVRLLANYANLTNWDLLGNSVTPPAGLTVFTSNSNILTYTSGGVLTGYKPGAATLTVLYQGTTNTALITVVNPAAPTLTHRYSFWNEPDGSLVATDSVSQANGIMNGDATVTGGELVLDGASGTDVQLPTGIITNDLAVTIEVWGTFPNAAVSGNQATWANLFDFGQKDANNADSYSLSFCVNVAGNGGQCDAAISDYDNANTDRENLYPPGLPLNGQTNIQLVVIFNPPGGYSAIYTNGALAATGPITETITPGIKDVNNWIGEDNWGDKTMFGQLSEFRIYNGVLAPSEVAQTYAAGPTNVVTFVTSGPTLKASISGTSLILSWPSTSTGFSVQSTSALKSGTWSAVSGTPTVVGGNYQLSVPISGAAQFFRLVH